MTRDRPVKALLALALLLATSLVVLVYLNRSEPTAPSTPTGRASETAAAADVQESIDLAPISDGASIHVAAGRTVAPGAPDADATIQPAPKEAPATYEVQVLIEANPWLAEAAHEGYLEWDPDGTEGEGYSVDFNAEGTGTILLPTAPAKATEFRGLTAAGLVLRSDELEIIKEASPVVYRLRVSLEDGASLVWAQTATQRPPVNVTMGGDVEPLSPGSFATAFRGRTLELRTGLELPLVLPRLASEEPVWVGATGLAWRAFTVTPDASRIEVALTTAATLRVVHDPPAGGDEQFVFLRSFPMGGTDYRAFKGSTPVEFTERPAMTYAVWVAATNDSGAPPLSRVARVELVTGETTTVDLTDAYARDHLGGIRVHAIANPETLKLAGDRLGATMARKTGKNPDQPWEQAGKLHERPAESKTGGATEERVFEAVGLESFPHRITVEPFGALVTRDIVPGEIQDVYVNLDDMGWVEFVYPSDSATDNPYVYLIVAAPDPNEGAYVNLPIDSLEPGETRRPVASGTYTARGMTLGRYDRGPFTSDPFSVQKGKTTTVTLKPRPNRIVSAEVHDADTGDVIPFNMDFWIKTTVVDSVTGKSLIQSTSFTGNGVNYRECTWQLTPTDAEMKITLPESPFWTFEDPLPLEPDGASTLVIRARAKD